MTTVSSTTAAALVDTTNVSASSESLISSDFDTWLTLLTAQLENQDPFDPVDSTEYTAQLAQFSAVEQQVATNDLLSELVSKSTASDMATMAEWVGKEIRVTAPAAYDGVPITVHSSPDPTASRAEIVIRKSNGTEINRFEIPTGESPVEWTGIDSSGNPVGWGNYTFEVASFDANGEEISTSGAEIYTEVLEVQRTGDAITLVLAGGTAISTDKVNAVRSAGS